MSRPVGPCPCECNRGGFCGGCGHAGCTGGINLPRRVQAAYDAGDVRRGQALNVLVGVGRGGTRESGGAVR